MNGSFFDKENQINGCEGEIFSPLNQRVRKNAHA